MRKEFLASVFVIGGAFVAPSAYAFEATYSSAVPDLLEEMLQRRNIVGDTLTKTIKGIARVAANDNVAGGAAIGTAGRARWLTLAARANWVGLGVTAVALTADLAYKWYYQEDGTVTDYNGPIPYREYNDAPHVDEQMEQYPKPDDERPYIARGVVSDHFVCSPNDLYTCAKAEAALSMRRWFKEQATGGIEVGGTFYEMPAAYHLTGYVWECNVIGTIYYLSGVSCEVNAKVTYTEKNGTTYEMDERSIGLADRIIVREGDTYSLEPPCVTMTDDPFPEACNTTPNYELPNTVAYPDVAKANHMPNEQASKAVNPDLLSRYIDDLWKRASQTAGYDGSPYPMGDPVTGPELAQMPLPSLIEVNSPISDPATDTMPWAPGVDPYPQPGTTPEPEPDPEPEPQPEPQPENPPIDMTDPGVPEPAFPEIPTIQQIMDPVLNVFPEVSSFTFPAGGGECPTASFEVFGQTYVVDAQCEILEQNRAAIGSMMMLMFALVSMFVVLRA